MQNNDKAGKIKSGSIERHASDMSGSVSRHVDYTPLDCVQYLEAKLILKPDPFTSVQSFRDFGKIVRRTAKQCGVDFIKDKKTSLRPEIREIIFLDTPDFALYGNAFILRRRVSYVDGFPSATPRWCSNYVTRISRRPPPLTCGLKMIEGKYRLKFKAETLPLKNRAGGRRLLYSHNCEFGLKSNS